MVYGAGSNALAVLTGNEKIVADNGGATIVTATARQIAGLPLTGNAWFVNATTGSDSNPGSAAKPFATLTAAKAAATANNGDVVYLTGTVHLTATLAWDKDDVALIGLNAPSNNCRARIASTGATPFSPLVHVTGIGCSFVNLGTFHGGFTGATGSQVCWAEAGGRNFYSNVQFLGGGDATTAALAGMRSLTVASGENLFVGCTFGLDTVQRITLANATLEFTGGAPRNVIRGCQFQAWNGLATNVHILIQAGGADRYVLLDDVVLLNFGTAMNAAITNTSGGGPNANVVLSPSCMSVGAAAIATAGSVYVGGPVPTTTTSSIGVLSHA